MNTSDKYDIKPSQSIELLKELHILTRDGKMNQDSRRKLKQVYHLVQFIEPLIKDVLNKQSELTLVDHGAGKSYLGFILNDLVCKLEEKPCHIIGIDIREDLVKHSKELSQRLLFNNMDFFQLSVEDSLHSPALPNSVDIVTALHACNTATDDAIRFALTKHAKHIVLVPCCQAEIASALRANKGIELKRNPLAEIWRHPIHTREFGSHITNVLRCLQLESHGYNVTVTELVGWEHSMKNELIIASEGRDTKLASRSREKLNTLLKDLSLECLSERFS